MEREGKLNQHLLLLKGKNYREKKLPLKKWSRDEILMGQKQMEIEPEPI